MFLFEVDWSTSTSIITQTLGVQQITSEEERESVTFESVEFSPIFTSVCISILYVLMQVEIDPIILCVVVVTAFRGLEISDVEVSILRNVLREGLVGGR